MTEPFTAPAPRAPEPTRADARLFYRRYLGALNARDFDRMHEFVHAQILFNGEPVTRGGMVTGLRGLVDAVPDFVWHLDDLVVEDDRLAARLTITGTPVRTWLGRAADGAPFRVTEYGTYRLRDGRFEHLRNLVDVDALRRSTTAARPSREPARAVGPVDGAVAQGLGTASA